MTAVGFAHHLSKLSTGFRFLYLIAALYAVVSLSVFGSFLLARDLTGDLLGAGSLAPSTGQYVHHNSHQLANGASGGSHGLAQQVSWPKRLRGVIETRDDLGHIFTVLLSSGPAQLRTGAKAPVFKPASTEQKPAEHTFSQELLRRPPPAN